MSHFPSLYRSPDALATSDSAPTADEQPAPATTATPEASAAETATQPQSGSAAPLISQARQWLQSSGLPAALPQLKEPLQRLGRQTAGQWSRLSIEQKVLGGALLVAGGWYLLRQTGGAARRGKSHTAGTLHELLLFVNDRIEGYQRAASESQDADLRGYYEQLASQSKRFANRLNGYLRVQDSGDETGTTLKGKLYRAWMEAKAAVTGYSETAVLGSNVYGEEWALKAYEKALQDQTVTGSLRREVQRQYEQAQQTYNRLQGLQAQHQPA